MKKKIASGYINVCACLLACLPACPHEDLKLQFCANKILQAWFQIHAINSLSRLDRKICVCTYLLYRDPKPKIMCADMQTPNAAEVSSKFGIAESWIRHLWMQLIFKVNNVNACLTVLQRNHSEMEKEFALLLWVLWKFF